MFKLSRSLAVGIALGVTAVVCGEDLHVDNNPTDAYNPPAGVTRYPTIQNAVNVAQDGDRVFVWPGTYTAILIDTDGESVPQAQVVNLSGKAIELNAQIAYDIQVPATWATLDGQNAKRGIVATLNEVATTVVRGLRVYNCRASAGAGMYVVNGSPTIVDMLFESNDASGGVASGGALRLLNSNSVIQGCYFKNNSADAEGGAVFNAGGAIMLMGCEFVGNTAVRGGGFFTREDVASVVACEFHDTNWNQGCGGISVWGLGAYAQDSKCVFTQCVFRDLRVVGGPCNPSREYAGVGLFVIGAQADVRAAACQFLRNSAENSNGSVRGGAVAIGWPGNNRGSIRISGCGFTDNIAPSDGGAIAMQSTDRLEIDGLSGVPTTFENNSAGRHGGAISVNVDWVDSGTFVLDESRFVNNAAGSAGGAIWIRQTGGAGSRILTDSVFLTNSAVNGGGVYLEGSAIRSQLGRTVYCGNDPTDVQGQYNELFPNCFTISCADSDDSGYPDTCEIPITDCNQDGIADDEQLVDNDVNNDLVPDDCQTRFLDFAGLEAELVPIASAGSSGYPATTALCWRVYAKTINESASVICVFGNAERSFSITASGGLYQNGAGGDTVEGISCTKSNPVLYDSFFTIEATCDQQIELLTTPSFPAFNTSGSFSTSNGAYYVTPGAAGSSAGSDKRILLMQLTTNQAIKPTTSINILGRHGVPDPNNGWYEWQAFGLQIPDPILVDCNNNGVHDAIEIATGVTVDADRNGLPDNCQQCRGDVDANGVVNLDDLIEVFIAWGDPFPGAADLNNDGVVNGADLAQVISGWGTCLPPL